jgi:hypothetical protein
VSLGHHGPGQYDVTVWRGLSRATVEGIVLKEGADQVEVGVSLP